MKPADYYLNDITEYVTDIVCVNTEIEAIKDKLRTIFCVAVYEGSTLAYILIQIIKQTKNIMFDLYKINIQIIDSYFYK